MKRLTAVLLCLCMLLCGCAGEASSERTVFAMDTVMTLRVWGTDAQNALDALQEMITATEQRWSPSVETSVPNRLNAGSPCNLSVNYGDKLCFVGADRFFFQKLSLLLRAKTVFVRIR